MIGHAIFQLRRTRRLTRQQLADLSGVGRSVIFQIEIGGTQVPQIRVLEKLAAAMGVGVGRLVNDRGAMLTALEDPLIHSLTRPVNLVRVLNQQFWKRCAGLGDLPGRDESLLA